MGRLQDRGGLRGRRSGQAITIQTCPIILRPVTGNIRPNRVVGRLTLVRCNCLVKCARQAPTNDPLAWNYEGPQCRSPVMLYGDDRDGNRLFGVSRATKREVAWHLYRDVRQNGPAFGSPGPCPASTIRAGCACRARNSPPRTAPGARILSDAGKKHCLPTRSPIASLEGALPWNGTGPVSPSNSPSIR